MLGRLLLLFLTVSVLEIWVLIRISSEISFLFALALCVFTFFIGSSLVRGAASSVRVRADLAQQRGEPPANAMAAAFLELIAGLLLMMPGVLSDIVGALLLLPPFRNIARKRLARSPIASAQSFSQFGFPGGFSVNSPPDEPNNVRAKADTKGAGYDSSADPFETDYNDGYTPPQPRNSGSVIIDAEIVE